MGEQEKPKHESYTPVTRPLYKYLEIPEEEKLPLPNHPSFRLEIEKLTHEEVLWYFKVREFDDVDNCIFNILADLVDAVISGKDLRGVSRFAKIMGFASTDLVQRQTEKILNDLKGKQITIEDLYIRYKIYQSISFQYPDEDSTVSNLFYERFGLSKTDPNVRSEVFHMILPGLITQIYSGHSDGGGLLSFIVGNAPEEKRE